MTQLEIWEGLFRHYRNTEMAVLYLECLRQGLKYGSITADNLAHIPVIDRKVVGAVIKGLGRADLFERIGFEKSKSELGHGRIIGRWELKNRAVAEALLNRVSAAVDGYATAKHGQTCFC